MITIKTLVVSMFRTNCYLIKNEETGEGFIIDPGEHPKELMEAANEAGVRLCAVLLTHGHLDHFRAAEKIRETLNIPIYAQSEELPLLADGERNLTLCFLRHSITLEGVLPLSDNHEFEIAGTRIRVLHTPGHTVGGCCYYLWEEGVLFSGDTLFYRSVGTTDFPGGNSRILADSIRNRIYPLPPETVVYPGHGESTTVGEERRENPFVTAD